MKIRKFNENLDFDEDDFEFEEENVNKKSSKNEKDKWWEKNYNRLINYVENFPYARELIEDTDNVDVFDDLSGKYSALMLLHHLSIKELEKELSWFESGED